MNVAFQKGLMWLFGICAIAGLAVFLMLYESSPGPLAAPHARAMQGGFIRSCKQCHTEEGLTVGCLNCHEEIQAQITTKEGYHAHLFQTLEAECEACHSEHHGEAFPLVSSLSWKEETSNDFSHPHTDFNLIDHPTNLSCAACHDLAEPIVLSGFEKHPRASTFLGLEQECIACHANIHETQKTRSCADCHSQQAFVPAPNFNHNEFFVLEGVHAKASCASCHAESEPAPVGKFGVVKGRSCIDCHASPHRSPEISSDCQSCHTAADPDWQAGVRGINPVLHGAFGFNLAAPHQDVQCLECHASELEYEPRFQQPARQQNECRACHADPHRGQFDAAHSSCLSCHAVTHFVPTNIGLENHAASFPLTGAHQAVACVQGHGIDPATSVRQFTGVPTTCKSCHENPHGNQFAAQLKGSDCTACHSSDAGSFTIRPYTHQTSEWFFQGAGHQRAACQKCHRSSTRNEPIHYRGAQTACAACHADPHRGQFRLAGVTDCLRCHQSTKDWNAKGFDHETHSTFSLEGGHSKLACAACHRPVPQPDGQTVIQFKPLTTRCEDCHGFDSK